MTAFVRVAVVIARSVIVRCMMCGEVGSEGHCEGNSDCGGAGGVGFVGGECGCDGQEPPKPIVTPPLLQTPKLLPPLIKLHLVSTATITTTVITTTTITRLDGGAPGCDGGGCGVVLVLMEVVSKRKPPQ